MLLEVMRERLPQRVVQFPCPHECRFGQRHGRADDLVLKKQVLRPELAEARVLDERAVGPRERHDEDGELRPQTGARRVGQWTALIFWFESSIPSFMSASPSLSTRFNSSSEKASSAFFASSVSSDSGIPRFSRCFLTCSFIGRISSLRPAVS